MFLKALNKLELNTLRCSGALKVSVPAMFAAMLMSAMLIAATSSLVAGGHVTELSVAEEQPIGTLVGSVRRRENPDISNLMTSSDDVTLRFNFRFSSSPYELFTIDARSGEIRTASRIDREELCPTANSVSCALDLDVTLLPLRFHIITSHSLLFLATLYMFFL